jgi:hypothetical protein
VANCVSTDHEGFVAESVYTGLESIIKTIADEVDGAAIRPGMLGLHSS